VWAGPEGTKLPFASFDEMEQFLATAAVLKLDEIGPEWKIWFIDSTRAFAPDRDLADTD
jgi:hypothetical protein